MFGLCNWEYAFKNISFIFSFNPKPLTCNMEKPPFRFLRGYSLDPGFSTRLDTMAINEITYQVRWEKLSRGPVGCYFEVVDFDPASNCFYDPVDLDAVEILAQNGL